MENKRLYRSNSNKMIAGICGGLGDYFNVDPTIVRLIFVFLAITGSAGFWLYLIMWIIVPQDPQTLYPVTPAEPHNPEDLQQ